jgi:VIT1/CCC1 family predicted Fe2+/Mn2+ transporter
MDPRSSLAEQKRYHAGADPHVRGRWLSDLVLGAQDGVVNTLGVLLGVASATTDRHIVLATGMAAAVAESISMAAVAYTSSMARGELYQAERAREYRHIQRTPDVEREEVRRMFAEKGFTGDLLERAVTTVCSNKDVWVATMMKEEHALGAVDRRASLRSALVVGGASLVASVMPVSTFWPSANAIGHRLAVAFALVIGGVLLGALGAFKARLTTGSPVRSGVVLFAIGMSSAVAGWAVGLLASR